MSEEQRPGWLQTLWNVNPRLAAEAEEELERLYYIEASAKQLMNLMETRDKILNHF